MADSSQPCAWHIKVAKKCFFLKCQLRMEFQAFMNAPDHKCRGNSQTQGCLPGRQILRYRRLVLLPEASTAFSANHFCPCKRALVTLLGVNSSYSTTWLSLLTGVLPNMFVMKLPKCHIFLVYLLKRKKMHKKLRGDLDST